MPVSATSIVAEFAVAMANHRDGASFRRVFDRVVDQVVDDLADRLFVGKDHGLVVHSVRLEA